MQKNNFFNKRVNRFKDDTHFIKEEYLYFDFNNNLKSNKIENLKFTNFLSSNKCNKYFYLLDICTKLNNNCNINSIFIIDEFDSSKYNSQRVYDIINNVNNINFSKNIIIYKLKNKKDSEIQFYVYKEENVLKLCLIDVYHLVIKAINQKTGKEHADKTYEKRKDCNFNIKEINDVIFN